jgi:N-acetylglucosaminyldiphosphoundecaprenol N-acetyl-beta-D-mannosaminyltransferase
MQKQTLEIHRKDLKFGQIMGINVLSTTISEVLTRVEDFISDSSELGNRNVKFSIVTLNPELILMAQKVPNLKIALNSADLPVPDGVGLKVAIPGLNIIKGRELFMELIELANKKGWKVFLLGGFENEAEAASHNLQLISHNLQIKYDKGPKLDQNGEPVTEIDIKLQKDVIDKINKFAPQLLFVAFGNPKQEIWIYKQSLPLRGKNFPKLNIGGAMAVGGTFRYVAGLSSLPPKWMESVGLEWLWRVVHEPKRIGRIFNAVVVFPLKVFWFKASGQ